jgi:hypothetical protein
MSEIVDTEEGSFRRVTDGVNKWWLWECPACSERQPINLDKSEELACVKCGHIGRNLGRSLVAHMQARVLTGDAPTHEEGMPHRQVSDGL